MSNNNAKTSTQKTSKRRQTSVSPKEKYILFLLGIANKQFNKRFKTTPLEVTFSKALFIELITTLHLVQKKERALYRNLELLEKKKFIKYKTAGLSFTKKGLTFFTEMHNETKRQADAMQLLQETKAIQLHHKLQTHLKEE